jgi:hypothetical protein
MMSHTLVDHLFWKICWSCHHHEPCGQRRTDVPQPQVPDRFHIQRHYVLPYNLRNLTSMIDTQSSCNSQGPLSSPPFKPESATKRVRSKSPQETPSGISLDPQDLGNDDTETRNSDSDTENSGQVLTLEGLEVASQSPWLTRVRSSKPEPLAESSAESLCRVC